MVTLLLVIAVGLVLAFVSGQNSLPVSVRLGSALFPGIPLYAIILGSFFSGVFLAWIFSLFGLANHAMKMMGKDKVISRYQQTTSYLHNRVRQLQLENAQLRGEKKTTNVVRDERPNHAGFFDQLRDRFTPSV